MSTLSSIRDLVQARLVGRTIDVVGFVNALLAIAGEAGEIRCGLATEAQLCFGLADQAFDIELDSARAKLRMVCARLGVLCNETAGGPVSLYGGDGVVAIPGMQPGRWMVHFKNSPDEQQFSVRPVEVGVLRSDPSLTM